MSRRSQRRVTLVSTTSPHTVQAPERHRKGIGARRVICPTSERSKGVKGKSPTAKKALFVSQTISENASTYLRWLTSGKTKPLASPAFPSLANALANPLVRYKRAGQSFPCPACRSYLANAQKLRYLTKGDWTNPMHFPRLFLTTVWMV